jgi:hypothetical protein
LEELATKKHILQQPCGGVLLSASAKKEAGHKARPLLSVLSVRLIAKELIETLSFG